MGYESIFPHLQAKKGSEREAVTWGHLYAALLLLKGKGHFSSQELSMESKGTGEGGGFCLKQWRGWAASELLRLDEVDGAVMFSEQC